MSTFASEIKNSMPDPSNMVPMTISSIDGNGKIKVKMAGSTVEVPASIAAGSSAEVGDTGYAIWKPPAPPLVVPTGPVTSGLEWHDITSFDDGNVTADSGSPPQYGKEGTKVYLRGSVVTFNAGALFTLPVGFRPVQDFEAAIFGGSRTTGNVYDYPGTAPPEHNHFFGTTATFLRIYTNGTVETSGDGAETFSLDSIFFFTD